MVFDGDHAKEVRFSAVDPGIWKAIEADSPGILGTGRIKGREFGNEFGGSFDVLDEFGTQSRSFGLVEIGPRQELSTGPG